MKLLAIDTATEACSAAIFIDGEVAYRYELAPRQHAELILPMVDQLLAEAAIKLTSLDALAFGRGPGAFTGVRIAAGVIQGLAFAADRPVLPISTLASLAQGAISESRRFISAIDARMGEIYWGVFAADDDNTVTAIGQEQVSRPELLQLPEGYQCYGIGSGWMIYREVLTDRLAGQLTGFDGERYPHARDIVTLAVKDFHDGKAVSAEAALPVYLRNKVTG
ncbi:MAG: tRNA (adenosine(37)-N6)-threonylcarbamoyltransferase complex dimerization subunit type 1 TsaB [Gammaproteobacteria bacterium]